MIAKLALSAFLLSSLALGAPTAHAGGDWNDGGIAWQGYEEGLAAAKASDKPVCLVFYTEWCPHCTNYAKVFHDERVVAAAKDLVMIRLDRDQNRSISREYAPEGEYIPRTFFLSPDGTMRDDVHAPRSKFIHFYDEHRPESVLTAMQKATEKATVASEPAADAVAPKSDGPGA